MLPTHKDKSWDTVETHRMNAKLHKFTTESPSQEEERLRITKITSPHPTVSVWPGVRGEFRVCRSPRVPVPPMEAPHQTRVTPCASPKHPVSRMQAATSQEENKAGNSGGKLTGT